MGTTVATNALLERKGAKTAFVVTEGFKDLLVIGNQSRPKMFDLAINRPGELYSKVIEVPERVTLEAWSESQDPTRFAADGKELVTGITGETVRILKPIGKGIVPPFCGKTQVNLVHTDRAQVKAELQAAFDQGFRALAVCLMHSYTFPDHERIVGELATEIGFEQVSLSSVLMPMCKIVPRAHSANADAYLTPELQKYITGFSAGFQDLDHGQCRCEFMKSDGGLVEFTR